MEKIRNTFVFLHLALAAVCIFSFFGKAESRACNPVDSAQISHYRYKMTRSIRTRKDVARWMNAKRC